jgi:hypothetical protein
MAAIALEGFPAHNRVANDSTPRNVASSDFAASTKCAEERYQTTADIDSDCSDSENGDDEELWGIDTDANSVFSFTRPSTPRGASERGCNSNQPIRECENESDTFHSSGWSNFCLSPQCIALDSGFHSALSSPAYSSTHPSTRTLVCASRDEYFDLNDIESVQYERLRSTSLTPPNHTPVATTPICSTGKQTANIRQLPNFTLQPLNIEARFSRSRATSMIAADEGDNASGSQHQSNGIQAPEDIILPMPNEPQSGPEAVARVSQNAEDSFNPTSTESGPELPSGCHSQPTPRPRVPHRHTSVCSTHSIFVAKPISRLYYRHDSRSCWGILVHLLIDPIHRIRARKRSVKESAKMDQELRELHSRMRESEMRMRQDGVQPPSYGDLMKRNGGARKAGEVSSGQGS